MADHTEVFKIAIYHFEAKMISRGTGRSVVAAAAYASCSKICNDYDGVTHDYTRKHGCVYSEIFLPSNAPPEWQDRTELWNAVEAAEKAKDSRLARELIVALPVEVGLDEWKSILKDFISEQCVNKGMCADVSIHDTDGHNPHSHILLTVRPLDDKGEWQAKTQKEYLCKRGDEERGFTAAEFKTVQADGWEKQYQYKVGKKKVYMTPLEAEQQGYERVSKYPKSTRYGRQNPICAEWNSEKQILQWRKAWEDVTNRVLAQKNIEARVDCRSFKERDIDEQPTIHEGVTARIMEKRGIVSDRCKLNRQISKDNVLLRDLKASVKKLTEKVKNSIPNIASALESIRNNLIAIQYQLNFNANQSSVLKKENTVIDLLLNRYRSIVQNIKAKVTERKKLQSEKNKLGSMHIVRHKKLAAQIAELTEDIEVLKSRKNIVLDDMQCENDKQVSDIEVRLSKNVDVLERLDKRHTELSSEKENARSEFEKIRTEITPDDIDAVQSERSKIWRDKEKILLTRLQEVYSDKYSYQDFKVAVETVDNELNDKPLRDKSIIKRIQRNQRNVKPVSKNERREQER